MAATAQPVSQAKAPAPKPKKPAPKPKPSPSLAARLATEPLYAAASAAVSRRLPSDIRDDVISSMIIAVLDGEIKADAIADHSREFIARHFREREWSKLISFNTPAGGKTVGEMLGAY